MKNQKDKSPEFIHQKYIQLLEASNVDLHKKSNPFSFKNISIYSGLFIIIVTFVGIISTKRSTNDNFDKYLTETQYNNKEILLESPKNIFYRITENTDQKWLADNNLFISVNSEEISFITTKESVKKKANNYQLWIPQDKQYKIILVDGTKIKLNANSSISFNNNRDGKTTNVILNGEAFFNVSHIDNQSFKICASEMDVEVFGTSFNISNYTKNNFTSLALLDGSVKITNPQNKSQYVQPGQQATIYKESQELIVGKAALSDALLWTANQIYFSNEKLESILRKINKWYAVEFIIEESKIKKLHFTGSLKKEDGLIHFLQMLEYTENINYNIERDLIKLNINKN